MVKHLYPYHIHGFLLFSTQYWKHLSFKFPPTFPVRCNACSERRFNTFCIPGCTVAACQLIRCGHRPLLHSGMPHVTRKRCGRVGVCVWLCAGALGKQLFFNNQPLAPDVRGLVDGVGTREWKGEQKEKLYAVLCREKQAETFSLVERAHRKTIRKS